MKPSQQVAVVIPFYKTDISAFEKISLSQCLKVLGKYPVIAVKPTGLDISSIEGYNLFSQVLSFDDLFFRDIAGYNKLMLSDTFYRAFLNYQFILIHQLDAFVFRDELSSWCQEAYDYIGAPWLKFPASPDLVKELKTRLITRFHQVLNIQENGLPSERQFDNMVGNGGFSLRRVYPFYILAQKYRSDINKYLLRKEHEYNEDVFWSLEVNRKIARIRIPSYRKALHFAFENRPELAMEYTKDQLPFGCHAWDLHVDFWRPSFAILGYHIENTKQ